MEPQIVLKIDNNHTLKASNFKNFLGPCPQTPLGACNYRTSVLMSTPNNFYPHTPIHLGEIHNCCIWHFFRVFLWYLKMGCD